MRPATVYVRSSETNAVFEIAAHLAEGEPTLSVISRDEALAEQQESDYEATTVKELAREVSRRNEGRPDDDLITPDSDRKADLIAALVADDTK